MRTDETGGGGGVGFLVMLEGAYGATNGGSCRVHSHVPYARLDALGSLVRSLGKHPCLGKLHAGGMVRTNAMSPVPPAGLRRDVRKAPAILPSGGCINPNAQWHGLAFKSNFSTASVGWIGQGRMLAARGVRRLLRHFLGAQFGHLAGGCWPARASVA